MFAMRDAAGIRPAFYYADDEIVVVASERPVIQTVMNVRRADVRELEPGQSLIVTKSGRLTLHRILPQASNARCSFERIYFSRGSDADIYQERKALGRNPSSTAYSTPSATTSTTRFSPSYPTPQKWRSTA